MKHELACPVCGEFRLRARESQNKVEIDGVRIEVPFHSHECEACGSNLALGDDLRLNARAVRQVTKVRHGLLTGAQVRALRKRLALSQEQAARLFGGGPVAFSKYENEDISQSEAMDRLLWLVGEFPWLVRNLAQHVNVPLEGDVLIKVERTSTGVRADYFAEFLTRFESSAQTLDGFREISAASNDRIYKPTTKDRPVDRVAA